MKYKLGKGGIYSRFEGGLAVVYKPGDPIELTPEQAKGSLRNRLLPWTEPDDGPAKTPTTVTNPTRTKVRAPATSAQPTGGEATPTAATGDGVHAPSASLTDFSAIPDMPAADVAKLIDDLDNPDELVALRDAEKTRPDGGRRSIINAVATRNRKLGAMRAQQARRDKAAARRGETAVAKGTGDGDTRE